MINVPEKLIGFRVYGLVDELLGAADVELPDFESMSDTVSGAGIAGEIDSPTLGHFSSMELTVNWRTTTRDALGLLAPIQHTIQCRGSIQRQNPGIGQLVTQAVNVTVRGMVKNSALGSMVTGQQMEASSVVEVHAITVSLDGIPIVELDKYAYIYRINGIDYLQKVRVDMGGI